MEMPFPGLLSIPAKRKSRSELPVPPNSEKPSLWARAAHRIKRPRTNPAQIASSLSRDATEPLPTKQAEYIEPTLPNEDQRETEEVIPGRTSLDLSERTSPSEDVPEAHLPTEKEWRAGEDMILIELRSRGIEWDELCKRLPGRSALSCRLRYQVCQPKEVDVRRRPKPIHVPVGTVWYCCQCNEPCALAVNPNCISCSHIRCRSCATDGGPSMESEQTQPVPNSPSMSTSDKAKHGMSHRKPKVDFTISRDCTDNGREARTNQLLCALKGTASQLLPGKRANERPGPGRSNR